MLVELQTRWPLILGTETRDEYWAALSEWDESLPRKREGGDQPPPSIATLLRLHQCGPSLVRTQEVQGGREESPSFWSVDLRGRLSSRCPVLVYQTLRRDLELRLQLHITGMAEWS